jgi:hypothetical protein
MRIQVGVNEDLERQLRTLAGSQLRSVCSQASVLVSRVLERPQMFAKWMESRVAVAAGVATYKAVAVQPFVESVRLSTFITDAQRELLAGLAASLRASEGRVCLLLLECAMELLLDDGAAETWQKPKAGLIPFDAERLVA